MPRLRILTLVFPLPGTLFLAICLACYISPFKCLFKYHVLSEASLMTVPKITVFCASPTPKPLPNLIFSLVPNTYGMLYNLVIAFVWLSPSEGQGMCVLLPEICPHLEQHVAHIRCSVRFVGSMNCRARMKTLIANEDKVVLPFGLGQCSNLGSRDRICRTGEYLKLIWNFILISFLWSVRFHCSHEILKGPLT